MQNNHLLVLGRNNNEVGNHLEVLAKELLAKLGFGSFVRNAYKTGAEIDLRAEHRVTGIPLLCECKARKKKMDTHAIKIFYAEWEKEHKINNRLHAMVISTSGYVGTAEQWYTELDQKTKEQFRLIKPEDLISLLVDFDLTLDPKAIDTILTERYSIGELHNCWLTYSAHGLAWVYVYQVDGRPLYHTIVNSRAKPLPNWKCQEITKMLGGYLSETKLFGLDLRRQVQVELFRQEEVSSTMISSNIQESETDVQVALYTLHNEGKLQKITTEGRQETFRFVRDVVPFVNVAKDFLQTEDAVRFLSSDYAKIMLQSPQLISYIDSRFNLGMMPDEQKTLIQLLLLSPTALWYALFSDTNVYTRTSQEIPEKIKEGEERQKWDAMHRTSLIQNIVPYVIRDIIGKEYSLSSHFTKLGIQRYRIRAGLDAIGINWHKLSVTGSIMFAIETAGEAIQAGSLISSTNPITHLLLDGLLFAETGEYAEAQQYYERALKLCIEKEADKGQHQAVLNNMAQTLMGQGEWEKAVEYLDQAAEIGTLEYPQLLTNKAICLQKLGDNRGALVAVEQAKHDFPEIVDDAHFVEILTSS